MKFEKNEIQKEIDRIQAEEDTPEFMLVEAPCGYYIGEDGNFWDEEEETVFFIPKSKKHDELLTELANAIIEQSL